MKLESEAAKLQQTYLAPRPPVAMRTFVGKDMQPGGDFAPGYSAHAGDWSFNHPGVSVAREGWCIKVSDLR